MRKKNAHVLSYKIVVFYIMMIALGVFLLIYSISDLFNFWEVISERKPVVEFSVSEIFMFFTSIVIFVVLYAGMNKSVYKSGRLTTKISVIFLNMIIIVPLVIICVIDDFMLEYNYVSCESATLFGPGYIKYVYTDSPETCRVITDLKSTEKPAKINW